MIVKSDRSSVHEEHTEQYKNTQDDVRQLFIQFKKTVENKHNSSKSNC